MTEYERLGPTLASFDVIDGRYIAHWTDPMDALTALGGLVERVEGMQTKGHSPGYVQNQGGAELAALRDSLIERARAPQNLLERATLAAAGLIAPTPGVGYADEDEVRAVKLSMLQAEGGERAAEVIAAKDVTAELSRWAATVMPAPVPLDPDGSAPRRRRSPAVEAYEAERLRRVLAGQE